MKRGGNLATDPVRAAERRQRREARREAEGPRPEDLAREERRTARESERNGQPRGSTLSREPALSDRLAERRRERARRYAARRAADRRTPRAEWDVKTRASVCAVCGSNVSVTGHHVLPLRMLKANGVAREFWYDPRNHLPLCDEPSPTRCHKRHETFMKRVPRELVLAKAPAAIDFADEVGLLHLFDREYPAA